MLVENRFTNRVESYLKYRPGYPAEIYQVLLEEGIIKQSNHVADMGCGTGLSAELFLQNGHRVYGVEPDAAMLDGAKNYLSSYPYFVPVNASAHNCSLKNRSIDLIICGQSFHWFDREKTAAEFRRILQSDGHLLIMWNELNTSASDFMKVFVDFIEMFAVDYREVRSKIINAVEGLDGFFGHQSYQSKFFLNQQHLDLNGLNGRVLSMSFMPDQANKDHDFMMYCLRKIFQRYQETGKVKIEYLTKIYYGQLATNK
jgi:SAM-dependent methyltransferase